ncbi:hypothetical protein THIOM_004296 [Candidatus Thiomargarita nelsonii]|uniref:Uncharacterized protein n=1 Tax=Candidatus Thiomargarita nelsonii TaxID=1003181 RepID=A0A176RWA9_9GAMM|nr:hypothetical protein THIOM_004296 [Candidatus Thiomargarita nelsonii]
MSFLMLKELSRKIHRRVIVSLESLLARLDSNFAYKNRRKRWETQSSSLRQIFFLLGKSLKFLKK